MYAIIVTDRVAWSVNLSL